MVIDENTKVILRLQPKLNARGLNIYNPYFQEKGINAIYLLAYNESPEPLVQGLKNLNFAGSIAPGFEQNPEYWKLMDELSPISKKIGKVEIIANRDGKLYGHYQNGYGLLQPIRTMYSIKNKKIVIMGAGTVVKALLFQIIVDKDLPKEIEIYNRTRSKAEKIVEMYPELRIKAFTLSELKDAEGEVFVNATHIGSPYNKGGDYIFTENFVKRFDFIVDVTFQPLEPQLIKIANKVGVKNSPGWRMFVYQAEECLRHILNHKADIEVLSKYVIKAFK